MIKGLSITRLTPSDLKAANTVFETTIPDAFEKEGLEHLREDIRKEIEHKKKMLKDSLQENSLPEKDNELIFLLAKLDGRVIGTISFGPCGEDIKKCTDGELDSTGELGSLFVLPPYQGQGVGSALIKAMIKELAQQGIEQFCLDSGYKRAQQRWLGKFGEPYKVVTDYWGPGTDHMIWWCKND